MNPFRFIISIGNVGTIAIHKLLSSNQGIYVPPYRESEYWLKNSHLLAHASDTPIIIQTHSYTDLYQLPYLLGTTHETFCLNVIRNPNDGLFGFANGSLFHYIARNMSPPTDIAAFFSSLFRQLPQHHFLEAIKICQRAGKHAAIDMSALSPPALSATTEQLSVFFEIENRFSPISIKENSQFDRFLFEKGIELNINEMPFVIRLSSYGEIVYSQFAHCIARLECPECWHKYLSPHREIHAYLQLTEKFNNFRIPVNTYNYIVRSCQAQMEEKFDAISSMLLHEFEECIAIFDGVKLSSLEGVFPVSISELMANIERAYQDFYPEIAQLWKC